MRNCTKEQKSQRYTSREATGGIIVAIINTYGVPEHDTRCTLECASTATMPFRSCTCQAKINFVKKKFTQKTRQRDYLGLVTKLPAPSHRQNPLPSVQIANGHRNGDGHHYPDKKWCGNSCWRQRNMVTNSCCQFFDAPTQVG